MNEVDARGQTPLMLAALRGAFDTVLILLKAGAKLNLKDKEGQTALMFAIQSSRPEKLENVRLLLKSGAKVNIKDNEDLTPLELAKKLGENEIVKLLAEAQTRH